MVAAILIRVPGVSLAKQVESIFLIVRQLVKFMEWSDKTKDGTFSLKFMVFTHIFSFGYCYHEYPMCIANCN